MQHNHWLWMLSAIGIRQSFWCDGNETCQMLFGREDDEIPDEVKNEELALEMLTMEAFELCKSGEDNCVTLNDIENCQETLGHFINTNDVHVPNELDFDEMDLNKDGKVCLEEWKEMKAKEE